MVNITGQVRALWDTVPADLTTQQGCWVWMKIITDEPLTDVYLAASKVSLF
jgi:hypothetical protein